MDNAIVFNQTVDPAFAKKEFRQAMEYAIDRDSIIKNLYNGNGTPLSCLLGNPAYHGTEETYAYDPEKAKALLATAGVDPSTLREFTFDTYYNDPLSLNVMTAIQANWQALGFKVKIQQMDPAAWVEKYYNQGKSEISFLGAQNGPDGNIAAGYYLSTADYEGGNGSNGWKGWKYDNPAADDLINKGSAVFDPAARAAIYQDLCKRPGGRHAVERDVADHPVLHREQPDRQLLPHARPRRRCLPRRIREVVHQAVTMSAAGSAG